MFCCNRERDRNTDEMPNPQTILCLTLQLLPNLELWLDQNVV